MGWKITSFVCFLAAAIINADLQWNNSSINLYLPENRSEMCYAKVFDNQIYAFNGFSSTGYAFSSWYFDGNMWNTSAIPLPSLNFACDTQCSILLNNKIYMIGLYGRGVVYIFDVLSHRWDDVIYVEPTRGHVCAVADVARKGFWVFGGYSQPNAPISFYNLSNETWSNPKNMSSGPFISGQSCVLYNNFVYLFGGAIDNGHGYLLSLDVISVYNVVSNVFIYNFTQLTVPRHATTAIVVPGNEFAYIFCGYTFITNYNYDTSKIVEKFSFDDWTVTLDNPLPENRVYAMVMYFATDNAIHIFGGRTNVNANQPGNLNTSIQSVNVGDLVHKIDN